MAKSKIDKLDKSELSLEELDKVVGGGDPAIQKAAHLGDSLAFDPSAPFEKPSGPEVHGKAEYEKTTDKDTLDAKEKSASEKSDVFKEKADDPWKGKLDPEKQEQPRDKLEAEKREQLTNKIEANKDQFEAYKGKLQAEKEEQLKEQAKENSKDESKEESKEQFKDKLAGLLHPIPPATDDQPHASPTAEHKPDAPSPTEKSDESSPLRSGVTSFRR